MKSFRCSLGPFNLCLLSVALVAANIGAAAGDAGDGLEVLISCEKANLLLAEPLVVSVTLTNASPTNINFSPSLYSGRSYAGYRVSKDGREYNTIGAAVVTDPPPARTVIRPGETLRHDQVLVYDGLTGRLAFPDEGEYFVRVDYRGHKSNVLRIQVKPPGSPADLKWTERLNTKDVLNYLAMPGRRRQGASNVLRDCSAENSTYAPYAAFALASAEQNKTNALTLFQKVDIAGFPLRSQALLAQARINEDLGNTNQARQQLERLVSEFPNTAAADEARKTLTPAPPIR